MPDDPKARRMRTVVWMSEESLRDEAFTVLTSRGFSPKKRPQNSGGWWGLAVVHNGEETREVSTRVFTVGYPQRMRHDPV
jgi:hypothetical protein